MMILHERDVFMVDVVIGWRRRDRGSGRGGGVLSLSVADVDHFKIVVDFLDGWFVVLVSPTTLS